MTDPDADDPPILTEDKWTLLASALVKLGKQGILDRPLAGEPDVTQLVRYLRGALSAAEARQVRQGLIASAAARTRLQETHTRLEALSQLSWAEVAARAHSEAPDAEVARAWLALTTERLAVLPDARTRWLAQGWSELRRHVAEGAAEAQAAWTAFVAFGGQWKLRLQTPRLATAKGGGQDTLEIAGELPAGIEIVLEEAELTSEGALKVALAVREASKPSAALTGRSVHLALLAQGERWPVAARVIEADAAAWDLTGIGDVLGLPQGPLPAGALHITVGDPTASIAERQNLLAEVTDARGHPLESESAEIYLEGAPHWENGEFTVVISLPPLVRAAYSGYRLALDLAVSAQSGQRLGAWPVRDWGDAPRTLIAPCPGSPDATVLFASILRARLEAMPTD